MWVLGFAVLVPYLTFSFSEPFVETACDYEKFTCSVVQNLPYFISSYSFVASYYAWWLLAPVALLMGAVYVGIHLARQIKGTNAK
ncbi:MAG: hypothetical protein EB103_00760 [Actinobacteria bacterium]|nr:hypothetical protein [Actinomycetota bacterium]